MERILITGATGFIGQALLRAWSQTAEVAVLTRARAGVAQRLSLSEARVFETPAAAAAFRLASIFSDLSLSSDSRFNLSTRSQGSSFVP